MPTEYTYRHAPSLIFPIFKFFVVQPNQAATNYMERPIDRPSLAFGPPLAIFE